MSTAVPQIRFHFGINSLDVSKALKSPPLVAPNHLQALSSKDFQTWAQISNGDPLPRPLAISARCGDLPLLRSPRDQLSGSDNGCLRLIELEWRLKRELFDTDRPIHAVDLECGVNSHGLDALLEHLTNVLFDSHEPYNHEPGAPSAQREIQVDIDTTSFATFDWSFVCAMQPCSVWLNTTRSLHLYTTEQLGAAISPWLEGARKSGCTNAAVAIRYEATADTELDAAPDLREVLAQQPDDIKVGFHLPWHSISSAGKPLSQIASQFSDAGYTHKGGGHYAAHPFNARSVAGRAFESRSSSSGDRSAQSSQFSRIPAGAFDCDVIGLGPGSASLVGPAYLRNTDCALRYRRELALNELPIRSGLVLESPHQLQREMQFNLYSNYQIDLRHTAGIFDSTPEKSERLGSTHLRSLCEENLAVWRDDVVELGETAQLLLPTLSDFLAQSCEPIAKTSTGALLNLDEARRRRSKRESRRSRMLRS